MVLNSYRGKVEGLLTRVSGPFIDVSPNAISIVAFMFAVIAGLFFYHSGIMILFAVLCVLLSSAFDALDGMVARLASKASLRGDLVDHSLDRYADIFILGGITFGPDCSVIIGFVGFTGVLMGSYMGTQAQALTQTRDYGGILGRADRLVLLIALPLLHFGLKAAGHDTLGPLTVLEYMMIWFAIAGHTTAVQRGIAAWRKLGERRSQGLKKFRI